MNHEQETIVTAPPVLVVVVPCHNEEEVLATTNDRLTALLAAMTQRKEVSERSRILYVDDDSADNTWREIAAFHALDKRVGGIRLAARVGQQKALIAGMDVARRYGDAIVSIDADLQDDINVITGMVADYRRGADIVYGVRRRRASDTWFKRATAQMFYRLMKVMGVRAVYTHADCRLMSRRAVRQLCRYQERNIFLRGLIPMLGYKSSVRYYDRARRREGHSKYPVSAMLDLAVDGITSFSVRPVRLVFLFGLFFLMVSLVMLCYVIYRYVSGKVVPGWSSLILSMWFIGGCILMGLGIVGEYIGKIYLEVKHRPRYDIEEELLD